MKIEESSTMINGKSVRLKEKFDFGWKFCLGDFENAEQLVFDDSTWRVVDLPHDWSIEGEYDENNPTSRRGAFLPVGIGWYRKSFVFSEERKNKKVFIDFDGIYMNSDVWINGHHLGHRPFGYMGLHYELTPYLNTGENVIAVRVDTSRAPSDRWYTGSGIYRHVWLSAVEAVHVAHWGSYVTTPEVSENRASVVIRTTVENGSSGPRNITLTTDILDQQGNIVAFVHSNETFPSMSTRDVTQNAHIYTPELWSPVTPYIYTARTRIMENERGMDEYETPFGVRYFEFDANTGFKLNGKPIKFKGVCHHHDAGPVGAAVPDNVLERRLKILKDMGCNAIRTSHNPMAPEFYDLCDRMGFMVMDEAFDGWETPKVEYDYHLYFEQWWQKDLQDMLQRDRNHPCVIFWSIGNEVKNMNPETTKKMVDFIHAYEPTRPVTCGVNGISEVSDQNRKLLDVAGYNDGGGACFILEQDHEKYPKRKFIITEGPHTLQTRGFYRTQTWWRDKNGMRKEIENLTEEEIFFDGHLLYHSSYDNAGVRFCARDSWQQAIDLPYKTGEFRWSGFDYLGESVDWPARINNFGIIDLCGFPKDHYYFYQSQWTDKPMVHLLPHWTHPGLEGVVIPVWVYTNCDTVELFLNDRSLGIQEAIGKMNLSWDVPYEPGILKAVARKNGEIAVEKTMITASHPERIKLSADNMDLMPDGCDISHIIFEIVDKNCNFVPHAGDLITFHISGPVKNLGLENGDPLDLMPHKINCRKAFNGLGLGIFQATFEEGDIEIIAAGILGDHIFKGSTQVAIAVERISLRGVLEEKLFSILYTVDGSEPTINGRAYEGPFEITGSCTVRACVFVDHEKKLELQAEFKEGLKEKVIDLTHCNREQVESDKPQGPFDQELIGSWENGNESYCFTPEGCVSCIGKDGLQKGNGYWWYDFPDDPFETPEYAGMGEIWWTDGKKSKLSLETQQGDVLFIITNGLKSIYKRRG